MQRSKPLRAQQGAGLIGALLIFSAFGILAIVALKALPAYYEYYTIQSTLKRIANDPHKHSDREMRNAFEHQSNIDRIESVTSQDLVISGDEISVSYEKKIPLYDNLSLLLSFDASSQP